MIANLYRKIVQRYQGIPILVVVYKPWNKGKNVGFQSIAPFNNDEYLSTRFQEIAERIRETHQENIDRILKEKEEV